MKCHNRFHFLCIIYALLSLSVQLCFKASEYNGYQIVFLTYFISLGHLKGTFCCFLCFSSLQLEE
jgi:hypothetical protein